MELVDAMRSQHACRYYKPDAVPEQVFYNAVEAARFGPQGGNRQPVRFLVVTDPAKKKQLEEWYLVPWKAYFSAAGAGQDEIIAESGDVKATHITMTNPQKALADADSFAEHFGDHPAIVIVLPPITIFAQGNGKVVDEGFVHAGLRSRGVSLSRWCRAGSSALPW